MSAVWPETSDWRRSLGASGSIVPWQESVIGAKIDAYRIVSEDAEVGDRARNGRAPALTPPFADALLSTCRKRVRPIVMTAMAMGVGMLPIAIGLGTDPSFRAPMAIVVIGDQIVSTLLILLVVPVVFSQVDDPHGHLKKPRHESATARKADWDDAVHWS